MNHKKAFTLIALLVVIAIIATLASVVLISIPSATRRSRDSRTISAIASAKDVMIQTYVTDRNYIGFSTTTPTAEMNLIVPEVLKNRGYKFSGSRIEL